MNPFFERDVVTVARELLGCRLAHRLEDGSVLAGIIVETEAYHGDDPASHSHRGETPRNRVMFGPPGVAYVYFIYGMYDCFNVVCEPAGSGAAVLIRALEPVVGLEAMGANRSRGKPVPDRELASGPGKLCRAMDITRARHNGWVLGWGRRDSGSPDSGESERGEKESGSAAWEVAGEALWLEPPAGNRAILTREASGPWKGDWPLADGEIISSPRVGISRAVDRPWRFRVAGSPYASRMK